jgi:hypothetical protein
MGCPLTLDFMVTEQLACRIHSQNDPVVAEITSPARPSQCKKFYGTIYPELLVEKNDAYQLGGF